MTCPACSNTLTEIDAGGILVDICRGGCGGAWFDWMELKRVDEPGESVADILLAEPPVHLAEATNGRKFTCPRCEGQAMQRHYFSVKRQVEVDECPACGGFWLDAGELVAIRELFGSEEEAREAARSLFGDLVEDSFAAQRAETDDRLARAQRLAHLFRCLCPSYWIPGKQEWGAH